jgi:putative transcriptional regulator
VIRWKLNEVMSRKRIRNKDLAAALDITENSIYRLRKTDEMPRLTPQRLEGICQILGCQPGELLEWVPDVEQGAPAVNAVQVYPNPPRPAPQGSILIQQSGVATPSPLPQAVLRRLTEFCQQVLALSWQGYRTYGPGAVIFTDHIEGPQIAYLERDKLSDPRCRQLVEQNRPEHGAVVLYYYTADYDSGEYEMLTLQGPKSPPDCYSLLME